MQLFKHRMPNSVVFVYDNGDKYTLLLDFGDGENYEMLMNRFSNPLSWTGIFIASGENVLHFIDLKKVRQLYFMVVEPDKFKEAKQKVMVNLDTVKGVAHGVLILKDDIDEQKKPTERVKDIPPDVEKEN